MAEGSTLSITFVPIKLIHMIVIEFRTVTVVRQIVHVVVQWMIRISYGIRTIDTGIQWTPSISIAVFASE